MNMPKVKTCNVTNCAYNRGSNCHALAVTIGDSEAPHCDTFFENHADGGDMKEIAGVGACKMEDCEHNEGLYCTASTIQVKQTAEGAVCTTYNPIKEPAHR